MSSEENTVITPAANAQIPLQIREKRVIREMDDSFQTFSNRVLPG